MKRRGLYIHVPFCKRKCLYCDFYSVTDTSMTESYTAAVKRNIIAANVYADTVYFGGGTPSLLTAGQIYDMLSSADISENAEITMECNPNSVDERYFREVRAAGINRISLGIQSLNGGELRALGRLHNPIEATTAVFFAAKAGFDNISADIMLATPYQTEQTLADTLVKLTALPLSHVSAYMLKIEPSTPFGQDNRIPDLIPDEDRTADMYLQTVEALENSGLHQYEISNFARNGCESRHNLKYWLCEEYYGIGCHAHSFVGGVRKACMQSVSEFIAAPVQTEIFTDIGGTDEEKILLGLRLACKGIQLDMIEQGRDVCKVKKLYSKLTSAGLARLESGRLMLTPRGCLISNEIICELLMIK